MSDPVVVDAKGHRCPVPSLKLMKAIAGAAAGSRFILLATDPMARIDVPFLMSQKNGRMIAVEETEGLLRLTVETGE
ncbi:sulfurtransferase TusA family protein [Brevundimonas intermedia]|uniref:Sulfurtransferase TusA family protein n=1 Tax=Brevundimonas intermedia TaxID=74315 RepID=A0A4Y9RVN5_9CAUL|nr:sulfurtransferase TusA family protein [Brevundimonas intermedia]TFW13022.1 sulfurtransferase TusA family protein [Brevundimonas intermedia]